MNLCILPCIIRNRISHDRGGVDPLAIRSTMTSGPQGNRVTGSR